MSGKAPHWITREGGRVVGAIALLAFFGVVPLLVEAFLPPYYLPLATEMLIMALFALGYDLLMGYTGMISFGHSAFLGLGAYVSGLMMLRFGLPFLPALILGVAGAVAAAAVIGFFSIRLKSVYFALLTLAFSQIFYQIAVIWTEFTGGYDGVALSMPMELGLPGLLTIDLRERESFYYLVLVLAVVMYLLVRRVVQSPFGRVLVAIRENEVRAETIGYDVARYKQLAFVLSGLLGGLAGALFVPYQKFLSPDLLYWEISGLVIVMVLLGGKGTLWGPVLGAMAVVFLRDWLTAYTKHHLLLLGLVFVALVLFAPDGVAGLLARHRWPRSARQPGAKEISTAEGYLPETAVSADHGH